MPTICVSTMILRGLRLIGEKERGGNLDSAEQSECLAEFNTMLDGLSIERLMLYHLKQESTTVTASVASTSIGPGATWNTTRPTRIVDPCWVRDSSNFDQPLRIIDKEAYGRIYDKTVDGTYPQFIFYDPDMSASSGALYLYPEPSSGLTLFINSWEQLTQASTITHNLTLAPGYQRMFEYNYALEAAGGFANVDPSVAMIARQSKAALKSFNSPAPVARMDVGLVRATHSNILTGP